MKNNNFAPIDNIRAYVAKGYDANTTDERLHSECFTKRDYMAGRDMAIADGVKMPHIDTLKKQGAIAVAYSEPFEHTDEQTGITETHTRNYYKWVD